MPRITLGFPTSSHLRAGLMESRERFARLPHREACRGMVEVIDTRYVTGYREI